MGDKQGGTPHMPWATAVRLISIVCVGVLLVAGGPTGIAASTYERYVDNFTDVVYDLDYRSEQGRLSTWLRVRYEDGTAIDISINDIEAEKVSGKETLDAIAQAYVGAGGRIFPKRMDSATVPRLWAARAGAIAAMEEFNHQFIMTSVPAVLVIISVAAQLPIASPARLSSPAVTRRIVSKPKDQGVPGKSSLKPAQPANAANALGLSRVQRLVNFFGREVVETGRRIKVKDIGSTDVDVVLTGKRFCEVGGPSKGFNLSDWGKQLKTLKAYADQEGGTAYFYYDKETPMQVIEVAIRWLGKSNVNPLP
jgi:hypothetical protein